jgi:hypothetical protein
MGDLKVRQISDNQCNICWGTGRQLEFRCPLCNSYMYGSSSTREVGNFKRHCHGDTSCWFSWMDYEDWRYFKPGDEICVACNGTGKESIWEL